MSESLPIDCLYRGLALNPDGIAAEDDRCRLSYRQLVAEVEVLAGHLQAELPVASRVALCARNHVDHVVAFLAILAAGCIWVPINPKNGRTLNRELLAAVRPSLLIADSESLEQLPPWDTARLSLDGPIQAVIEGRRNAPFVPARPAPEAVMAIKFTGGTTGRPRGVLQSHRSVAAVVENLQAVFGFQREDCNVIVAPLTHGASHYILPLLAVGGRHLLLAESSVVRLRRAFREQGGSVAFMPPTLIYKLLDTPGIDRDDFPELRHLTYSAAPMPSQRIRQAIAKFGPVLSTVYGQTEAPMTITALGPEALAQEANHGSVGRPCRHSEVAIVGQDGTLLDDGDIGEVCTRGAIVMSGYLADSRATAEILVDGWLHTGDLGYRDARGLLFLVGRAKELIISGGFNVYPAEVENVLAATAGVRECAVFGRPDDYWGEVVEAAVCLDGTYDWTDAALRDMLRRQLGPVKTPKRCHFIDRLPRNPVGKVVRREVRNQLLAQESAQ